MNDSDSDGCPGTNRNDEPCGHPEGWGTDFSEGACKFHRGTSPDGSSHEGNTNAVSHGAYTDGKKLYHQEFAERERDLADRIFADYHGRYVATHGEEPPLGYTRRLSNIAINNVTEMRVENWYTDKPDDLDTATPHLDRETHISEGGRRYYRYKKSPALAAINHLSNYNYKWLKAMDLLPESDTGGTTVNVNVHEELLAGMKAANGHE